MKIRKFALVASLLCVPMLLVGCVPGSDRSDNGDKSFAGTILTAEDVRNAGGVTLNMTDFGTEAGTDAAFNAIIADFEAEFPNITINRNAKEFSSYSDTLKLTMSGDDAPDIAQSNVVLARNMVEGGLIAPLDDYYEGYEWGNSIPEGPAQLLQLSEDGKTLGTGSYWGTAPGGNMVLVYYNKAHLDELGLELPESFEQFQSALDAAKAEGIQPIQLGNLEQFYAGHLYFAVDDALAPQSDTIDWIAGKDGATFATDANVLAATLLQDWAEDGYLPAGANGIRYEDARAAFTEGEGLFLVGTTYVMAQLNERMGENVGAFVMPPSSDTSIEEPQATGWLADPFVISSGSEHPDIAAYFLDYMNDAKFSRALIAGGMFPFSAGYTAPAEDVVVNEALNAWRGQLEADTLVPYLDFATPSMGTVLFPALQSLIGSQIAPAEFADTVQQDWAEYHDE